MKSSSSVSSPPASTWKWALLLVPLIVALGMVSGWLSGSGSEDPWFAALRKPAIFPPAATFGIVWTILYVLMGFSLALVVAARDAPARNVAIGAFIIQLALNLAWSPVFFGAHQITGALIVVLLLDIAVIVTVLLFWRVRRLAGALLLPYLAWVLFATLLTWEFLQANPDADGQDMPAVAAAG